MAFRRIARPLLAATFIAGGVEAVLHPKPKTDTVRPLLDKAQQLWPAVPSVDPVLVAQAEGAVQVGAGLMMALGRAPRLAALVLALDLIPTTAAEYPFPAGGHAEDRKAAQRAEWLRRASLLGGLLLAVSDTRGKPSLAWRARQAKKSAEKAARRARKEAGQKLG